MDTKKVVEALESLRQDIEVVCMQLLNENPKPEPDWEKIAEKEFLVSGNNFSQKQAQELANQGYLVILQGYAVENQNECSKFKTSGGFYKYIAFPRISGIRQPCFGECPEWIDYTEKVVVKYKYADKYAPTIHIADDVVWSNIAEFILLP